MQTLWQDLRYGFRMLAKKPGFTAITALTLALGIGANTALFSMINAVLLRPLPFKEPERVVMINDAHYLFDLYARSLAQYLLPQEETGAFAWVASYQPCRVNLTDENRPSRIQALRVTADFFPLLGINPLVGRAFTAEEQQEGRNRVIVIGYDLWQGRFGADPHLLGKTVKLNGHSFTIIGIMPRDFHFYIWRDQADAWIPLTPGDNSLPVDSSASVIARLASGLSLTQVQSRLQAVSPQLRQRNRWLKERPDPIVSVTSLRENWAGDLRRPLLILFGAVGFVLLIACANTANLLLARAATRQKEVAIRAALGASRWRLMRQWLTESLLLALLGGALGVLLAAWSVDALVAISPVYVPRIQDIEIDGQVLAFTIAVSMLTGLLFGLAPAWQFSRPNLNEALKEGGHQSATLSPRLRNLLTVSEVALALVLLIGAGLLIKSFRQLITIGLGFNPTNILTLELSPPKTKYPDELQRFAFYQQVIERIRAVPGVQYAAVVDRPPVKNSTIIKPFQIEGRASGSKPEMLASRLVSADYFRVVEAPLIAGRYLTDQDGPQAPRVVMIDQSFARQFFPNENPIGKRLITTSDKSDKQVWEIVGMVGDIKQRVRPEGEPLLYWPLAQFTSDSGNLFIRSTIKPTNFTAAVRDAIWAVDKDHPIYNLKTMEQYLGESLSERRFSMLLLSVFAAVALALSVIGLYGVMSYSVAQRTHEIGIRMALGAQPGDVLKLVVGQGMKLVLIGVATGLAAAFALTRLMTSLLYSVSAADPVTFVIIPLLLAGAALLACYIPARRAMKVDPMVALRYE